jgi:hypothetical protein
VSEYILDGISELEGVHVAKPELDVRIDHKLGEPNDLTTEMEGISEA